MWKIICFLMNIIISISTTQYGAFNVTLKRFEFCKGPKVRDCCNGTTQLSNGTLVAVEMLITENVIPTRGKVVASSNVNKDIMRLHINKPCVNVFLKSMFQNLLRVTSKCEIPKGRYKFFMNFQDMVQRYYGGKYFYGLWRVKTLFYNNHCNIICTETEMQLTPA